MLPYWNRKPRSYVIHEFAVNYDDGDGWLVFRHQPLPADIGTPSYSNDPERGVMLAREWLRRRDDNLGRDLSWPSFSELFYRGISR